MLYIAHLVYSFSPHFSTQKAGFSPAFQRAVPHSYPAGRYNIGSMYASTAAIGVEAGPQLVTVLISLNFRTWTPSLAYTVKWRCGPVE
jgi:hypothetical protein